MNQHQALDLASEHMIVVTVDTDLRDGTKLNKIIGTKFKVGQYVISRARGHNVWCITDSTTGGTFCWPSGPKQGKTIQLPRGDAMQFAIELTIGAANLTAYEKNAKKA